MEISGKKAVVVGGASGFGRATAESLAKRGASVAILDRAQSDGKDVASAMGAAFHEVDVTDFAGTETVLQTAIDALGGLHIIVTTAATAPITMSTIAERNNLSAVPNIWMAHSLNGPGVRSITAEPTAVRASALDPNGTATRALTPSAIAAPATPDSGELRDVPVAAGVLAVTAIPPRYRFGGPK